MAWWCVHVGIRMLASWLMLAEVSLPNRAYSVTECTICSSVMNFFIIQIVFQGVLEQERHALVVAVKHAGGSPPADARMRHLRSAAMRVVAGHGAVGRL